jgi:hypothetical protein
MPTSDAAQYLAASGANASPYSSHDDLDDFRVDGLRSFSSVTARAPASSSANPLSPSHNDLDDFGIDVPYPLLTAFHANALPPSLSSQNGLDNFGLEDLRSPSPDAGRVPYPSLTTSGTNALLLSLQDGLDDFGLDNLCSPSPESSCAPSHVLESPADSCSR